MTNKIEKNSLEANNTLQHHLYENTKLNYETKALALKGENGEDLFSTSKTYVMEEGHLTSLQKCYTRLQVNNLGANIVLEAGNFEALWREELKNIAPTKNDPIIKTTIKMHEIVATPVISRRLANLCEFDVRNYVQKNVERSILHQMDLATITGDGLHQPMGIINADLCYDKAEKNKILTIKLNKKTLMEDLLRMETQLSLLYRNGASWIISRGLFNEIQTLLLHTPHSLHGLVRDGLDYRLFGRPLMIFDGLDYSKKKIHCILIHPSGYTVIEDHHMDIIENNQDIDLKLIFVKNFGGAITNYQGIILGEVI